jgi:SecA DEAD-like domain
LTQMTQFRKEASEQSKQIFDRLLPEAFHSEMNKHLQNLFTIVNGNNEQFLKSLRERNAQGLLSCLNIAFLWKEITGELVLFNSACDDLHFQPAISDLMTAINKFHHTGLVKSIEQEMAEMVSRVTLNISTYLTNPEKGIATREAYFLQLIKTMDFVTSCEPLKIYFDVTSYKNRLLESTHNYLTQLYIRAKKELPKTLEPKQSWETFNDCYKDLSLFVKHCAGYAQHLGVIKITFDANVLSSLDAVNDIEIQFNQLIDTEILRQKEMIDKRTTSNENELRLNIIHTIISLQRIINTLPSKSDQVKKSLSELLGYIREKCHVNYFQLLMTELQAEESGLGLDVINQQACFRGMSIALRNTRTSAQDIEYVLNNLTRKQTSGAITPLSEDKNNLLRSAYAEFQTVYDKLLTQYLKPEVRFDDNPTKHLKDLLNSLKDFIQKDPVQADSHHNIIWNKAIIKKIPVMMAYLFVIWTLRDAKHYFEANSNSDSTHYLKKPHPGQVIAIFRMLNITEEGNGLSSHLVQTLSGEGKSIVVAITAVILAMCGFSVSCACYSEYLSSRDFADFANMFELLEVGEHIKYGTFNTLCEDILNEQGDLRHLMEDMITRDHVTMHKKRQKRETIVIIDEVDVFFNRAFYGSFYNPVLRFNPEGCKQIADLVTTIWTMHKHGSSLTTLTEIQKTPMYKACLKKWSSLTPLLDKAIKEMLNALNKYKEEQGHQYTVINGKIAYPYHDGTTTDIYKGYKTMWAYCYEHDQGKISDEVLAQNIGLLINCGHYAYSEMVKEMGFFKCILGVTGTLRELSEPEQEIVRNEFSITQQTFIPSVYGPNRLRFAKKDAVKIESDHHYYSVLAKEIKMKQMGTSNDEPIRPVLVFFEDQTSLMNFYKSKELKELGIPINVMTQKSSSTTAEQNSEISKATSSGQVTLAVQEKGRGRDFYCMSPKIEANGGMHVIIAFYPEQVSLETQLLYRTARQGLDGSASMVLNEAELKEKFQLTDLELSRMRDNDNSYASLNQIRINKFAKIFGALTKEMIDAREVLHTPSFKLWRQLHAHTPDCKKMLALLEGLNPALSEKEMQHVSRTLILMDATGSMSSLIDGVKQTVSHVMNHLTFALEANKISPDNVALQLAIYRNYWESSNMLFQASPWAKSNNVAPLNAFIESIYATGGSRDDGHEAIEVGLCHAVLEADKKEGLTQVILIGDMPPNSPEKLHSTSSKHAGGQRFCETHKNKFYSGFNSAHILTGKLAQKKIPVFTFFVDHYAEEAFSEIAKETNGNAEYLDVNSKHARQNLTSIFGKTVLTDVASGDEKLKQELLKSYGEISHSGVGPGKKS